MDPYFPGFFETLHYTFILSRSKGKKRKKKDIRKIFMQDRAQSTQGGKILAFIKLQVAKSVCYVGVSV